MQELVQRIVERAGISEESATQAIDTVIAYVKEHAPAPIAAQVESYLTGETNSHRWRDGLHRHTCPDRDAVPESESKASARGRCRA
jgi:hypothetical protein